MFGLSGSGAGPRFCISNAHTMLTRLWTAFSGMLTGESGIQVAARLNEDSPSVSRSLESISKNHSQFTCHGQMVVEYI